MTPALRLIGSTMRIHPRTPASRLRGPRCAVVGALAALLVLGGPAVAWAVPAPSVGPTTGGTVVSGALPDPVEPDLLHSGDGATGNHTVLVDADGRAVAWGDNADGQLGDGTTATPTGPVLVQAPPGVTFRRVTTGDDHTVAIASDGTAYAWRSESVV